MASPARLRTVLLALAALLAALLVTPGPTAQAAADKGIVNGNVTCPKLAKCPNLKLQWFDEDWNYLGSKKANGGGYSLTLPPGTYRLQFVDQRPSYDTSKFAPTDVKITVRANRLTARNVTMQKGASLTGTVKNGKGQPLGSAKVVAARTDGAAFATQANRKGQFAVGGLAAGKYSIFTFDPKKTWVDKSTWAGGLDHGQSKNFHVKLRKRAGSLTVYLFQPQGLLKTKTTLTVTSKATGQWWSAKSSNGTFVFRGVHPGRFKAEFEGAGVWFAKTGAVNKADVKPGRMAFGEFRLTKRGGWVTGVVVDGGGSNGPTEVSMEGVSVGLYDASGRELATSVTDADGRFKLQGQLATQDGLTITVDPSPNGGGWMKAAAPDNWCLFEGGEAGDASVITGEESFYGLVYLPRSTTDAQTTACLT